MKSIMFYLGYIPRRRIMEQMAYCQVRINNNPINSFNHTRFFETNKSLVGIDSMGYFKNRRAYRLGYVTKRNILLAIADLESDYMYYELENNLYKKDSSYHQVNKIRDLVIGDIKELLK